MRNKTIVIVAAVLTLAAVYLSYQKFGRALASADPVNEIVSGIKPVKTMKPFASEKELQDYFREQAKKLRDERQTVNSNSTSATPSGVLDGVTMSKAEQAPQKDKSDDESITNTQHAGVDEGGIVKVHGDHLVILRRGRLFTVRIGDDALRPVAVVDAYAPGVDPRNDWYDEMLVTQDTVAVVGYSYGRGGTEINLFDIDNAGRLAYRSTYHLRSNDYYSSRNYASRMIGTKLIFYTPQYLGYYGDPTTTFPAVRRWHKGATPDEFERIVPATNVYRASRPTGTGYMSALHTVTVCDLADRNFSCKGTSVLAAPGRVFYVSPNAVYVWTTDWIYGGEKPKAGSMLYRMPLDGSAPSALGVEGTPVDQFSFLESEDDHLNVLVRSDGFGENMWGSEFSQGDIALLRTPLDNFSDGSTSAGADLYRDLPKPEGYTFQNRFVGSYLLYGTGSGWGAPEQKDVSNLFAVNWTTGGVTNFRLQHGVDRIEQMGKDAIVIGTNGQDLYFTPVSLSGRPKTRASYARKNASQGELRSHGFFYKSEDENSGIVGLPIAREARPGYRQLIENSAAIIFLRNDSLKLAPIGELGSETSNTSDDCKASCVDWYGNARPIFLRGRIFALLGYELVEGRLNGSELQERRRVNYSRPAVTRYSDEDDEEE